MCTSLAWNNGPFYFGRNLDLETAFGQQVVLTPRKHGFALRRAEAMPSHYGMIGMATVVEGCPLYAEAVNEKGLCIAGLNFPQHAHYPAEACEQKANITPFELPWWLLGRCANLQEAHALLDETHIIGIPFGQGIPLSPLHWHVADKTGSLVVECMAKGMRIHENPVGVLTNSPPFDFHMHNLAQYMNLTAQQAENRFSREVELQPFGRGMGAFGLPGDASPASRFVRAAFLKLNSVVEQEEAASVAHFFHLLEAVAMTKGSVMAPCGAWEHTLYACCMNADTGTYYYKTYGNSRITAVKLHKENLDGEELRCFPLEMETSILCAN